MRHRLVLFYFFCAWAISCSPAIGWAQAPYAYHFAEESGLPANEIFNLLQDRQGNIWVCTDDGLFRYNGIEFVYLPAPPQCGRGVTGLQQDGRGRVWLHDFKGHVLYVAQGKLVEFTFWNTYHKSGFAHFDIDAQNNLWITSGGTPLYCIDPYSLQIRRTIRLHQNISELHETTDKHLLYNAQTLGIGSTDINTGTTQIIKRNVPLALNTDKKSFVPFRFVTPDPEQPTQTLALAIGLPQLYTLHDTTFTKHPASGYLERDGALPICAYLDAPRQTLWVGTYIGVYCFRKNGDNWVQVRHFWQDKSISSILCDREGQLWFATLQDGILVVPAPDVLFFNKANTPILRNEAISHLAYDALGNLYFDTNDGTIYCYHVANQNLSYFASTGEKRYPMSLAYDPYRRGVWVAGANRALLLHSQTGQPIETYNSGQQKNWAFAPNGALFTVDAGGLSLFAPTAVAADAHWYKLQNLPKNTDRPLPNYRLMMQQRGITVAYDVAQQRVWAGLNTGLLWVQRHTTGYLYDKKQPIAPTDLALAHDTLYAATQQQGLYIFKDTILVAHLTATTTQQGLLSNHLKAIAVQNGTVWIATDKGIQGYTLATQQWQNLTRANGLATYNVADIAVDKQQLAVATNKGLQLFHLPLSFPKNTLPPIAITTVAIADRDTTLTDNYTLPYYQNSIRIGFEGLAYRSRGEFSYRYRLLGLSNHWTTLAGKTNFASYPSLPAGKYAFEVVTINENGVASAIPATVHITVLAPWWQAWWAYILLFLAIIGVVSAIFGIRFRLLRQSSDLALQKSDIAQQLRASQLAALKVQMNPHFIFNALNSIQEYIVLNEKRLANAYLGKFADLMRYTLDMSQKVTVPLASEIKVLHLYLELESLRFEKDFTYHIAESPDIAPLDIQIPPMLLQPYIENAVKHGLLHRTGIKKLSITIRLADHNNLHCTIIDNGIGRRRAQEIRQQREAQYASFATSATQKRLELLNYGRAAAIVVLYTDLYDAEEQAVGTQVELLIPFA